MAGVDDSCLSVMADELVRLTAIFSRHRANGCREFCDISTSKVEDLFIVEMLPDPASRTGGCFLLFKPTRLYEELAAAAWAKAAQLDAGVVNADGLPTHERSPVSVGGS